MVASRGTALLFCAAMTTGRVPTGLRRFHVSLPRPAGTRHCWTGRPCTARDEVRAPSGLFMDNNLETDLYREKRSGSPRGTGGRG